MAEDKMERSPVKSCDCQNCSCTRPKRDKARSKLLRTILRKGGRD